MKPAITVVSGVFYPDIGGPPTYLDNLLMALHNEGWKITVITFGDSAGTISYPFSVYRISRNIPVWKRMLKMIQVIIKKSEHADVLYVNDYGIPAYIANWKLKKPLVMKIVGDFSWENSQNRRIISENIDEFQTMKKPVYSKILSFLQYIYTSRALKIITPSYYLKQIITGWGVNPDKIEVIYNSVKKMSFPHREKDGCFRLITVCRLAPWKGVHILIDAVKNLREQNENISLTIVGSGPEECSLREQVKKYRMEQYVHFTGALNAEETRRYMCQSDAFILNSGYEGLSHVLLEAMYERIPVLASRKGGNAEVVGESRGILFDYNDVSDICRGILEMKQTGGEKYIQSAEDFVNKNCSFSTMYEHTRKILEYYCK